MFYNRCHRPAADSSGHPPRSGVLPLQHVDHTLESKPLRHRLPGPHQPPELRAAELLGVQALLLGLGLLEVALLVGVDDVLELDQLQRQLRNTTRSAQNESKQKVKKKEAGRGGAGTSAAE